MVHTPAEELQDYDRQIERFSEQIVKLRNSAVEALLDFMNKDYDDGIFYMRSHYRDEVDIVCLPDDPYFENSEEYLDDDLDGTRVYTIRGGVYYPRLSIVYHRPEKLLEYDGPKHTFQQYESWFVNHRYWKYAQELTERIEQVQSERGRLVERLDQEQKTADKLRQSTQSRMPL
jgi:hypothetical protein